MKIRLVLMSYATLVLAAACAQEQPQAPAASPGTVAGESATASVEVPRSEGEGTPAQSSQTAIEVVEAEPAASANITISSLELGNPVVVGGLARTFENNVSLRLRDARGVLITESFTTATGEMGQHSPYRGSLWLTRDPGPSVLVEALEYSAKDGAEQSLVSARRPFAAQLVDVSLYFPDETCTVVRPYTRRVPKSISAARLLAEALISGPTAGEREKGAESPFPGGSRVESVNLREGTLTVNFNERLQNVGGACAAQMIRQSVTSTMQALPSVKRVVITAGGSEKLALQP